MAKMNLSEQEFQAWLDENEIDYDTKRKDNGQLLFYFSIQHYCYKVHEAFWKCPKTGSWRYYSYYGEGLLTSENTLSLFNDYMSMALYQVHSQIDHLKSIEDVINKTKKFLELELR